MTRTAIALAASACVLYAIPARAAAELTGVTAIAAGSAHTCALMTSGEVMCWGRNEGGQLGDGTSSARSAPVRAQGLPSGIASITANNSSTCALASDGQVKCWGTIAPFVPIAGATVAAVAVGGGHACVLTSAGGVACWGGNSQGQLGIGTTGGSSAVPVGVTGLSSGVTAITAGLLHTCALTTAKRVKCWGANTQLLLLTTFRTGQLGDGTTTDRNVPVDVVDLDEDIVAIDAGDRDTCAITATGILKCWGDGEANVRPVAVTGIPAGVVATSGATNYLRISLGFLAPYSHRCAALASGAVKCWGSSRFGQLGDGYVTLYRSEPVDVVSLGGAVTTVAAASTHSCALRSDGRVMCWGSRAAGQLGDGGAVSQPQPAATDVNGLAAVQSVSAGGSHTCARSAAGGLVCWGANRFEPFPYSSFDSGALGDGTYTDRNSPVSVVGLASGVATVSAGGNHSCAVLQSGGVRCWGFNGAGQLGDGSQATRNTPADVSGLSTGATDVSLGTSHSCALLGDGGIRCWGGNQFGQLGNGSTAGSTIPVAVSNLPGAATEVVSGGLHTCARTATSLACWGFNSQGQLGDGTTTQRGTPTVVPAFPSGVAGVAAGFSHTCALTLEGGVQCWGANDRGQLGDNGNQGRPTPADVLDLRSGVSALAAGAHHTCALLSGGGVKCWGANERGQLGGRSRIDSAKPIDVFDLPGPIVAITAGDRHTCALAANGNVRCWGANGRGELGDRTIYVEGLRPLPGFVAGGFTLSVAKIGTGSGTVSSDTPDISCGASCSAVLPFGSTVTLSAVPDGASLFAGWSGGGCSGAGPCTLNISDSHTVSAKFGIEHPTPRPVNISSRGVIGTGDDVMIAGFIVSGVTEKTIVVSVAGASLAASGIANPIADPRLSLHRRDGSVIAANDDWENQRAADVEAIRRSALQPAHRLEPAVIATVTPGPYTAIVSGVASGTGVGLIAVYEVDRPQTPFSNISTRAQVLTGNDVLIAGFIVHGSQPQTVVVRARGPSLAAANVPNVLMNPVLNLYSGQTVIASNDDWQAASNASTLQASGFAPDDARESAIYITLDPGAYTAIVRGVGGTTGIGIVEVFAVP